MLPFGGIDLMQAPAYVYDAIEAVDSANLETEIESANRREKEVKLVQEKIIRDTRRGRSK